MFVPLASPACGSLCWPVHQLAVHRHRFRRWGVRAARPGDRQADFWLAIGLNADVSRIARSAPQGRRVVKLRRLQTAPQTLEKAQFGNGNGVPTISAEVGSQSDCRTATPSLRRPEMAPHPVGIARNGLGLQRHEIADRVDRLAVSITPCPISSRRRPSCASRLAPNQRVRRKKVSNFAARPQFVMAGVSGCGPWVATSLRSRCRRRVAALAMAVPLASSRGAAKRDGARDPRSRAYRRTWSARRQGDRRGIQPMISRRPAFLETSMLRCKPGFPVKAP